MAYSNTRLFLLPNDIESKAGKTWRYLDDANESDATLTGAGFLADAVKFGMAKGDLVHVVQVTGPKYKLYQVASVSGFAATLQAPTAIT